MPSVLGRRCAAASLGACVLALAAGPPAGAHELLWSADMETGSLSEWDQGEGGGAFNTASGSVAVERGVARSGAHALALSIRGADGRNGPQAARIFRWSTASGAPLPRAAVYSAWFYFPRRYTGMPWWNVFQWKTKVSSTQVDPTFVINVGNRGSPTGPMRLDLWDAIARRTVGAAGLDLPVRRWVHVQAYYRWSTGPSGSVSVYQDGRWVMGVSGVRTQLRSSDDPDARQWAVGNYTVLIHPADAIIYVDDASIGAAPAAGGRRRG
jgi:Polysaccharide lyase